MKKANANVALMVIALIVVGLSVAFVIGDSASPTGYVGYDVTSINCDGFDDGETCSQNYQSCGVRESGEEEGFFCVSPGNCNQGESCTKNKPTGTVSCGGRTNLNDPGAGTCEGNGENDGQCQCPCQDFAECNVYNSYDCGGNPSLCVPTNPEGDGLCACDGRSCLSGVPCSTFTSQSGFARPCGTGHCQIIGGGEDNGLFGVCICENKSCLLIDDVDGFEGKFDQCENTKQCVRDSKCKDHDDCGGVGLGVCDDGECQCECESWAPCEDDDDCGDYNEEGAGFGRCIEDDETNVKECMCTDDLGCSPEDCEVDVTPCSGQNLECGGAGEDACDELTNTCNRCGVNCRFTQFSGDGDLDSKTCQNLGNLLGTNCNFDAGESSASCDCPGLPGGMCDASYNVEDNNQNEVSMNGEGE